MELYDWVRQQASTQGIAESCIQFSRRRLREALGWNATQLAYHLRSVGRFLRNRHRAALDSVRTFDTAHVSLPSSSLATPSAKLQLRHAFSVSLYVTIYSKEVFTYVARSIDPYGHSWLAKQNYIPFSPATEIELPKQPKTLPKAISSAEEVELILQQPETTTPLGIRDRAIFEVLYSTGIRRAELCSLQIDNIHVDRQVLFISQGKGQKDRYVPIGHRALLWVARYVEHARDKLALDSKERTLFVTGGGNPIHPDSLTEYGRRYIKAAKVEKPGACHIFRHTMATLMHDAGADIRTIQAILGHEKLDTTQIYTRVSLKKLLETHQKTHPAERPDEPTSLSPADPKPQ